MSQRSSLGQVLNTDTKAPAPAFSFSRTSLYQNRLLTTTFCSSPPPRISSLPPSLLVISNGVNHNRNSMMTSPDPQVRDLLLKLLGSYGVTASPKDPRLSRAVKELSKIPRLSSTRPAPPPTSSSFFTKLPAEIREQIYGYVFAGSPMIIGYCKDPVDCEKCGIILPDYYDGSILHTHPACAERNSYLHMRGPTSHKVLQTCRQMYQEARCILALSLKVYINIRSDTTLSVMLHGRWDHQFLRYAAPYVGYIYTTICHKKRAVQLPLLFTNVECLEFGPGLSCCNQIDEAYSGDEEECLLRWIDAEVEEWTEDSDFHIKPVFPISWHLNIGGQLGDGTFCVSNFNIWLELFGG